MGKATQHNRTQWATHRRRAYIEHQLFWCGHLGLSDLMSTFDLSRAQASKEINAYKSEHPENIVYDLSAKTYVPIEGFTPKYSQLNPSTYLNDLVAMSRGEAIPDAAWYSLTPDVFSPPIPVRGIKAETLRVLMQAIDSERHVRTLYQSMSAPEPKERTIAPHALCFDGFRWHVRAYCFDAEEFRDFVISRIVRARIVQQNSPVRCCEDVDWNTNITLEIGPHPDLSEAQRRVVELDYEMTNGRAQLEVRKSMLFYTLKRLGLDTSVEARPACQQHIILTGPSDLLKQMRDAT